MLDGGGTLTNVNKPSSSKDGHVGRFEVVRRSIDLYYTLHYFITSNRHCVCHVCLVREKENRLSITSGPLDLNLLSQVSVAVSSLKLFS